MLVSEKVKLEKQYLSWCEEQNKKIKGGKLNTNSFINVIAFLESIGFDDVNELKKENETLRERLEKAVTPEFKIYEDVYFIDYVDEKGYSDHTTGKPKIREAFITCVSQIARTEFLYRLQPKDLPQEILNDSTIHEEWWDWRSFYAKEIFKTREAAVARLAELKGGKE